MKIQIDVLLNYIQINHIQIFFMQALVVGNYFSKKSIQRQSSYLMRFISCYLSRVIYFSQSS
jgi:hypothetical protein